MQRSVFCKERPTTLAWIHGAKCLTPWFRNFLDPPNDVGVHTTSGDSKYKKLKHRSWGFICAKVTCLLTYAKCTLLWLKTVRFVRVTQQKWGNHSCKLPSTRDATMLVLSIVMTTPPSHQHTLYLAYTYFIFILVKSEEIWKIWNT